MLLHGEESWMLGQLLKRVVHKMSTTLYATLELLGLPRVPPGSDEEGG
jgi:hypothetical protein